MLCQPHMILYVSAGGSKALSGPQGQRLYLCCLQATWNSNYMVQTSPGKKKSYCKCYQDNITNRDWNLCEYKWKPLHFSRYSEFKSVKVREYLIHTECSLPLMTNKEFIIKGVREEFATTKILFLQIKLLLVFLQIYSVY